METKISLGALGFPAPPPRNATTGQQPLTLPVREENTQLSLAPEPDEQPDSLLEVTDDYPEEETQKSLSRRLGTNSTIALPNLPKPQPSKTSANFDLKQRMKTGIPRPPQLVGLPTTPSMLDAAQRRLEIDHSKEEALTKLATKTIIDVQRLEVEFEKFKGEQHEIAMKLQNTIDYLNAVYLQVQMLNAQNMYMAWHGRLVEYNLAGLAGVQMERDLLEQARSEVHRWQLETVRKQGEAESAFAKLSP